VRPPAPQPQGELRAAQGEAELRGAGRLLGCARGRDEGQSVEDEGGGLYREADQKVGVQGQSSFLPSLRVV
jgi:hypothetical protein